ncbi:MAG: RIP metalloprotease RseP [Candidatus Altimarinota bacterium]
MAILFGILLTLVILTVVVFIHEMGHFLAARSTKMRVEEFGIGIPPRAKKIYTDKKGTTYTLNWLPIGGFVRIHGEDGSSEEANDTDSFSRKKWWARVFVLIAGVTMNFFLAWFIFTLLLWKGSSPLAANYLISKNYGSYFLPSIEESIQSGYIKHQGIILDPISGGPADGAGIEKGDILRKIDNTPVYTIDQVMKNIESGNSMSFTLLRSSTQTEYQVEITPMNKKIKSYLRYDNIKINTQYQENFAFSTSLKKGLTETITLSRVTFDFLGKTLHDLIRPNKPEDREIAKEMISGPIGMGAGMVELVKIGVSFETVFLMMAFLSLNLGVLNILPFPALDGGRIVSTTIISCIGWFTQRKALLKKVEQSIHALGMILLIVLSLLIAFHDIFKL